MLVPITGVPNPREMNQRQRAFIPDLLRQQNPDKFPPVYVFNIFDREWVIPFGAWGTKRIPACPKGEAYSEPLVLKGVEIQEYDLADGQGNMSFNANNGIDLARDLIGVNSTSAAIQNQPGMPPCTTNLEWWGVFTTENAIPTKQELATAKSKLTRIMTAIFEHGKQLAASGPNGLAQIGANHNAAAEFLGVKNAPWMTILPAQEGTEKCPQCLEEIIAGARFCKHCHQPIERESAERSAEAQNPHPKRAK